MLKHITSREDWNDKNVAQKGFTLIELLVVIAVLGILAVVGVLAFGGITQSAKDKTDETELAEVKTAAKAFEAETGAAPAGTAGLGAYLDVGDLRCTYGTGATFVAPTFGQTGCTH